jgi:deazaflavin-dependent oxidoreductase (nitroreductase family)
MILVARVFPGMKMRVLGQPVLILTTIGALSGRPRSVPLLWFPDEADGWLVIGSFGGAADHPAWYVNLARNPEQVWIEVEGRKLRVQPELLSSGERAATWERITSIAARYAEYQDKTDREIPVVRLRPV